MQDENETWNKVFAFVQFMEEPENDAVNRLKKAVEQGAVIKKERTEPFVNGKNKVLWVQSISLKDIFAERSMQYLLPQVGQNLEWQRKGTNLSSPQWGQPYMAPS